MKKSIVLYVILAFFVLLFITYMYRTYSQREIDDVTPGIYCEEEYVAKSDVLWVIPIFQNKSIAEDKEWCEEIIRLNKTLGMHGVYHTYYEFSQKRNESYIQKGVDEFEKCFHYKPKMFKAPQMGLTSENEKTIEGMGIKVIGKFNQVKHKVYHCSDTGVASNKLMDLF